MGVDGPRYCVVSHLLSVSLNQRVRVKVFCPEDDFPVVPQLHRLAQPDQNMAYFRLENNH